MFALALALTLTYPGGTFDPTWTNAPSAARLAPVGFPSVYRFVQPDGTATLFREVDAAKGTLVGDRPWVGARQGARTDLWTDPALTGGKVKAGFTFVNGLLRHLEIDGVPYDFPKGLPFPSDSLGALFPERPTRSFAKGSAGDIWKADTRRLRLWFANPNCAGAFLAQLFFLALAPLAVPAFRRRLETVPRGCRVLVAGLSVALAAVALLGVLKTGSRGALLGLVAGSGCLLLPFARRLGLRRGLAVCAAGLLALGLVCAVSGQGARLADTFRRVDAGNALRIKVARAAAAMLADAPFGWRSGEVPARSACLNWYVLDEGHIIRTHLVTLAELGWLGGFAYLLGWVLLLAVGGLAFRRRDPLPLAVFGAFFLAGCLNPVYREWSLWLLPGALLAASIAGLRRGRARTCARATGQDGVAAAGLAIGGAAVVSALALAGLVIWGRALPRSAGVAVRAEGAATLVNGDSPSVWIVEDTAVLGGFGFPGREILSVLRRRPDAPAIGYVQNLDDLPSTVETLVLPGRAAADFLRRLRAAGTLPCAAKRIVFLSPPVGPDDVPASLLEQAEVRWHVGSLAALRAPRAYRVRRPWVVVHAGCELYIPGWLDLAREEAFSTPKNNNQKGEQT